MNDASSLAMDSSVPGPTVVYPLGSGPLMPSLLLGWETTLQPDHAAWSRYGTPPWIVYVDQQAGGYCMTCLSACGVLFRLEGNAEHARPDPSSLVAAFHAMAEDPRPADIEKNEPRLRGACQSRGQELSPEVLRQLTCAVGDRFDLPECESGLEAFVRLRSDERAGEHVIGWRCVEPVGPTRWLEEPWPSSAPPWRDGLRFEPAQLAELRALGSTLLCVREPPRLFLLWENSD